MSNFYYGGTSSSTSSTYYYTDNIEEAKLPVSATILETYKGGQTWQDVLKVGYNGDTFTLGDYVEAMDRTGKIVGFTPTDAVISMLSLDFPINVRYSKVKHVSSAKMDKIQLNPNEAFKRKKRGRY